MNNYLEEYIVKFIDRVLRENPEALDFLWGMVNENMFMVAGPKYKFGELL